MSRVAKFLENELDRVNDYLAMAKANLVVATELCDDRCKKIAPCLSSTDEMVIDYLERELSILDAKINNAREIIYKFKDYFFEIETDYKEYK